MKLLQKIFGDPNEKYLKSLQIIVDKINSFDTELQKLSNEDLRSKTKYFKELLNNGKTLDDILPEAFAVVREASVRTTGMRHFDVQLLGGIVLHQGQIAEMKTGEGKTLVATLPMYLNALTGKGAHLITVNDYLARRDAVWMGQIYNFLGCTISCIQQQGISYLFDPTHQLTNDVQVTVDMENLRPCSRKEAYAADIIYGTNNEFGFDYLRDNMVVDSSQLVQRELYYTIVDEIDSILIDEARTPLIISAPAEESANTYLQFAQIAREMKENDDYNIDEKMRAVTLTESGIAKVEKILHIDNIYTDQQLNLVYHIENALKAKTLFIKDKDYIVKDGEVVIVDEFTGRLMFGRRYSEGLHQAIEAKENVKVQQESQTLASITFQNYFRMYKKLSGMTGTAYTEAEEFYKIYGLEVTVIPTNRSVARKDLEDSIYKTEQGKFAALIKEVKRRVSIGQPILIGTVSVEKNELLHSLLERAGVQHEILNAKNHAREAEIIAQAGSPGAVTVATNMAGRGVDIILGGQPFDKNLSEKVKQSGGLHVIGTERHESRRIDNQLRGRSGRQGDPGSTQFYISMEDDLMRIFGSDRMKGIMTTLKVPEDMPIENRIISKSIETAQKKIEGHNFDIRKHLVEYDDVINKHREAIYRKRKEILLAAEDDINKKVDRTNSHLKKLVLVALNSEIEQIISFHSTPDRASEWNIKEITETLKTIYPVSEKIFNTLESLKIVKNDGESLAVRRTEIIDAICDDIAIQYNNLEDTILKGPLGENPVVMRQIEKSVYLRAIDIHWIAHLDTLDRIRQGIGLRGYGQRDPLVEYKKEAYRLFNELTNAIQNQIVYSIFKVLQAQEISIKSPLQRNNITLSAPAKTMEKQSIHSGLPNATNSNSGNNTKTVLITKEYSHDTAGNKVGRNDLCPCGSGKKYKKCHGK